MAASIPAPISDGDSQPYWKGIARGELRIQRCDACSRYVFYPRSLCPYCYSDHLSWVTASGKGTVYSYTVAHQAFGPFAEQVPFVVAIVELEEGVRMMTRLVDTVHEEITIGAPVQVTFEQAGEDITLPYFRLTR